MSRSRRGRREFLRRGLAASAFAVGPFEALQRLGFGEEAPDGPGYGPLRPVADDATGLPLLSLPKGFRYRTFGWTGDPIEGAPKTPPRHDGMAVVAARGRRLILVRNHEVRDSTGSFGAREITYDRAAGGGTSNLVFDLETGSFVSARISLAGTSTNCAGGPTPWGSWLTCEETLVSAGESVGPGGKPHLLPHGFVFEVPGIGVARAKPLTALGRFVHEATGVDPGTGIVYETEDALRCGLYRFLPNQPGKLEAGGSLQMLALRGEPGADLGGHIRPGDRFSVDWVAIEDPLAKSEAVFGQGHGRGGAVFTRLEGAWFDRGLLTFISTSGGPAAAGQVWEYDPGRESLRLVYVSLDRSVLKNPDNVTVSPRGGILLCEDGDVRGQRLLGLSPEGRLFDFAVNEVVLDGEVHGIRGDYRAAEWCGATFSPDGRWLFANLQTPGITFAVTGPWEGGAL